MKVVIESFQFIDSKPEGERDVQVAPKAGGVRAPKPKPVAEEMDPDSIPF
jgi:hypothetical protein